MRRLVLAALLATTASIASATPTPKEQLMVAPAGARHYTISSAAGKHGDVWAWQLPDGRAAYRMSMSLRGWITETDEVVTLDATKRPISYVIRGYTDTGEATENFSVDKAGVAHWTTVIDSGAAPFGAKRYNTYGGPPLANEFDINALVAAGPKGIDLLPGGHASISVGPSTEIQGPQGARTVKLAFATGYGFTPHRSGSMPTIISSASPASCRSCPKAMRRMGRSSRKSRTRPLPIWCATLRIAS